MYRSGLFLSWLLLPAPSFAEVPAELASKAKAILETHCYACHGQAGKAESGIYVLNREKLVADRKLIPGTAAESPFFRLVERDRMPPDEDAAGRAITHRPSKEAIGVLRAWIDAGAPDFAVAAPRRTFISNRAILESILADLKTADERTVKFYRYFTRTHLYNAGKSEEQLQSYRAGISKLLNSLSWKAKIKLPTPIDPAKTILRIDVRDYRWSTATWDAVLKQHPYGLTYPQSTTAQACYSLTECPQPSVRGDWFVYAASKPPLRDQGFSAEAISVMRISL